MVGEDFCPHPIPCGQLLAEGEGFGVRLLNLLTSNLYYRTKILFVKFESGLKTGCKRYESRGAQG